MMEHLDVPRRGVVGPWAHIYPQDGSPGPAIGFLQDATRWWDRWLKGVENDIDDEPVYRVWMQDSVPPQSNYTTRPGRWIAETAWPSPDVDMRRFHLNVEGLGSDAGDDHALALASRHRPVLMVANGQVLPCRENWLSISDATTAAPYASTANRWHRPPKFSAHPWSNSTCPRTGRLPRSASG